jgi:tetratricopeptide (TPR) repeat protein
MNATMEARTSSPQPSAPDRAEAVRRCEERWKLESSRAARGVEGRARLLETWTALRREFGGTEVYEARLAMALAAAGEYVEAKRTLLPLLDLGGDQQHVIDVAAAHVDFLELFGGTPTEPEVRRLEQRLRGLASRYPAYSDASYALGMLKALVGEHDEAIPPLERALELDPDLTSAHRSLAMSYVAVGRYADGRRAADEAARVRPELAGDPWLALAVATADGGVGRFQAAFDVLNALSEVEEIVRHPDFKNAVDFVRGRWEEAKAAPPRESP